MKAMRGLVEAVIDGGEGEGLAATAERLAAYRGSFSARTYLVLRNAYPQTVAALGARWEPLGRGFVYGPGVDEPNLNRLGRNFAGYLAGEGVEPDTVVLAELEWARVEAWWGKALPVLELEALDAQPRVTLQPHLQLTSRWAVWRTEAGLREETIDHALSEALRRLQAGLELESLAEALGPERLGHALGWAATRGLLSLPDR